MKAVVFIDMTGLHDIAAANILYNDETKEIQLLFRIMIQLGIFSNNNANDLAQTFNDFFTSLTSCIIVIDHYDDNSEACRIIKNALHKINNANGEIILVIIHQDYDYSDPDMNDNDDAVDIQNFDKKEMILKPFTDEDAINLMLDLYYYRYNSDLGFNEDDVRLLVKMCSNRPGLIYGLAKFPYSVVSQFITESTYLDTNGEITVNISNLQKLLHQLLKKEEKMVAECLAIFCSPYKFMGLSCCGYKFDIKLAWCLCETLFKKEGHLVWKRALDNLISIGWLIVGEKGHYHIAASNKDKLTESAHIDMSDNLTNRDVKTDSETLVNSSDIVKEVLIEILDSIDTIDTIDIVDSINEADNVSVLASNVDDECINPIEGANDDMLISDFNRNLLGTMMMVEQGASSSSSLFEAYKVYTLFWCKELVELNDLLVNSNDSYVHVLMSFDENRVHFELVLAILVQASRESSIEDNLYQHILQMASILSRNISDILSRRMLPKHLIIIMQSIINMLKGHIDSSVDVDVVVELQLIDMCLHHGNLLQSVESLKEGIKHMQRTLTVIYDFYSKYPDKYLDKTHLSSAFFLIFDLLDKKISKSQKSRDMAMYYLGLKESYIVEFIEIFTPILGIESERLRDCRYQIAATIYIPSSRYAESISILNDLHISCNDSDPKYWDIVCNLASCHYESKEYERAKELYMKALNVKKSINDDSKENQSSIASILNSLGHVYYDQVLIDEAKGYYEEAYMIVKKLLGTGHIFVINIMISIANCFMTNCDYDSAHKIFYRIVGKRSTNTSNDQLDNELVTSLVKLHKIFINQFRNDKDKYKLLIEQVLDMLKILLDDDNNSILVQAKKEYRSVLSGESILRRLSGSSSSSSSDRKTLDEEKNINEKKVQRKSLLDNINIPFRAP